MGVVPLKPPVPREDLFCAFCGGQRLLSGRFCPCDFGAHWTCSDCRRVWGLAEGTLRLCPDSDAAKVARELMA